VDKTTYKELYDLYSSPNIIWVIKSRRKRWVGYVALMGDMRVVYSILVGETWCKETAWKT
jgi:hypothetical protein